VKSRERIILAVSLAFVLGALAVGILENVLSLTQINRTITSTGSVKGIGVGIYWDSACTNPVSSIDWGAIDPGSNKTMSVYVRNEGNAVVTLSRATQNWNPSTSANYMTLSWNYAGQSLSVNQVLPVRMMLSVSRTISGITNFGFDIIITAQG
jgi:hypothetical protein